jgi:hypothetical protein
MRPPKFCLPVAIPALIAVLFAAPTRSFADTYQTLPLTADSSSFYGMDDLGHAVFSGCGMGSLSCYQTFSNGLYTGATTTAPNFAWDFDAAPCNIAPCSASDNGRTVTVTTDPINPLVDDVDLVTGSSAPQQLFQIRGIAGDIAINGSGDIIFDNGLADEWYQVVDLNTITPEPGSIVLLSTGVLALGTILTLRRRRLTHA